MKSAISRHNSFRVSKKRKHDVKVYFPDWSDGLRKSWFKNKPELSILRDKKAYKRREYPEMVYVINSYDTYIDEQPYFD